jgi:membrane-associated phospholipid phosphatase
MASQTALDTSRTARRGAAAVDRGAPAGGVMMRTRTQLGLFGAAYLTYLAGRWVAAGQLGPATEHARWIIDLERDTGVGIERSVQNAFDAGAAMWLLSQVYLAAQLAVLPGSLLWLYRRAPEVYRRLRDTVLATWLIAIPIYALFPVAPPRLAGLGMSDAVSEQAAVALTGRSTLFYNELAAVPSLHCGFAVAIGIALSAAARHRATKVLWLLWGPLVCLAVVATANHYVFDIAAGLLVSVLGYLAGPLPARWWNARRRPVSVSIATPLLRPELAPS